MDQPATQGAAPPDQSSGLLTQMLGMTRAMFASSVIKSVMALMTGSLLVILLDAVAQILLNQWNKPFYDALSRRDMHDFMYQLGVFFAIAALLLVLDVSQRWVGEMLKLKLREGLVQDLLRNWMQPRRAFWLAHSGPVGENPDQRMHEDARHLCELSSDLVLGLMRSTVLFLTFAGVLWVMSREFEFRINGRDYGVPGFMVWAAVIYALTGSMVSWWVGRSLVDRNAERYAREADLRFAMVRANEHLDDITLASGEGDEFRRIGIHLTAALGATRRIVTGLTNLTWVTAGFGWVTQIVPTLVAAPLYFSGKISFGGLMMAAAAFTQAQSSLRWFIDNFSVIADWRATLLRVANFREALVRQRVAKDAETHISYRDGEAGVIAVDGLRIDTGDHSDVIRENHVVVHTGDRLIIDIASGAHRTQLFRALAGLWDRGTGVITRPPHDPVLYMPRATPYLPRGTLREVLAYPQEVSAFAPEIFAHALQRLGQDELVGLLDEVHRWDRELAPEKQTALLLARMVVHVPNWVLMDGTLTTLENALLERFADVMEQELRYTAIVHIGTVPHVVDTLFGRVLHLVSAPVDSHAQ